MPATSSSAAKDKPSPRAEDGASPADSAAPTASAMRAEAAATNTKGSGDDAPPLPDEAPPDAEDDGWDARWDSNANAWYFYNHHTGVSQWENPRVPEANAYHHASYDRTASSNTAALPASSGAPGNSPPRRRPWGGYNPAIHGSYDPNADYAQEASKEAEQAEEAEQAAAAAAAGLPNPSLHEYAATAHFNRFTGKFQQAGVGPELHNDEHKSGRQMNAFFDVDASANSHDGRSLKAERRNKPLSKKELKEYQAKRKAKKEHKKRAWLKD